MTSRLAGNIERRTFVKATAAALTAPFLLRPRSSWSATPIKVGFVSPQTGPLAFFGEPDAFLIKRFTDDLAKGAGGRPIEIIVKDSQSSASRAADLATDLILRDEVNLLITAGGPDTVIPVAGQAEINGTPLICTSCPWQPFVFGRDSTPDKGFEWTYLFSFGLEDVIGAYMGLWATIDTNKKVGLLFANDADGNAWGNDKFGFPPALAKAGYEVVDTGRYTPMSEDFTPQIAQMKKAGVDIVAATMIPPEFFAFWSQAAQQGFRPQVATIGKTLLLPTTLEAIGQSGDRLSAEVAWHPSYPFSSTLTGETPVALAAAWEKETGKQWTQLIGSKHALIDVAIDVLRRSSDVNDPAAVVKAIQTTKTQTVTGDVNWAASPIKNVAKLLMAGGQWRMKDGKFDITICAGPEGIPVTDKLLPLK
jgi:branched-chain amino acid transport system substrate-binding protein